jgi:hypothetical protein
MGFDFGGGERRAMVSGRVLFLEGCEGWIPDFLFSYFHNVCNSEEGMEFVPRLSCCGIFFNSSLGFLTVS